MEAKEAKKQAAAAKVEPLGDAWGDPLWRVHVSGDRSVDVHAADEAEARKLAAAELAAA